MEKEKENYVNDLEKLFIEGLSVKNRKQLKELLIKLSRINVQLTMGGFPIVENLPLCDELDEMNDETFQKVRQDITIEITDAQEKINML